MNEHVKKFDDFVCDLYKECRKKHIVLLASSSSFFLILTFVPFTLLITRLIGLAFGNETSQFESIFEKIVLFLPRDIVGVVAPVKDVILQSLFAKRHFTFINVIFLFVSSLGFVNSIWRSLVVITGDASLKNFKKYLRGLGIVIISFLFISASFTLPLFLKSIDYILTTELVTKILSTLNIKEVVDLTAGFIFSASIITGVGLLVYMTVLIKYLLNRFINLQSAFSGALVFLASFIILKSSFLYYVDVTRKGLIDSYGAYYSVVLLLIWLLASMTLFYFSIIFSMTFHKFYQSTAKT